MTRTPTFVVSAALQEWLVKYYPICHESVVVERTGLTSRQVRLCARRYGLRKLPGVLEQLRSGEKAAVPLDEIPYFREPGNCTRKSKGSRPSRKHVWTCMERYCWGPFHRIYKQSIIEE